MSEALEILSRLEMLQAGDVPTHGGRTLSYVYDSGRADADAAGRAALAAYGGSNGLDPLAFPSLLTMENDLVALAGEFLAAPTGFAGTVTSGGTESILLAVLAARDAAGLSAAQQDTPSMVLPSTAHAAFHKAAHYLGVRAVVVDVDPHTYRADPDAMAQAIDPSTILLVGSAPSYAHGVVDPIAALGALGMQRGLRVHVDACIGGWVLPFLPDRPPWNFAVAGVTSMSVDLHKYGYTPKGVSILLHRNAALRKSHFFAAADWPGYTMLNTTMQSTKSGGPLAAAWTITQLIGRDGYADLARTAADATGTLAAEIGRRDLGLRVLAPADSTLLAVTTVDGCGYDVFTLADEMQSRGWLLSPQLPFRGGPPSLHVSLCAATAPLIPELLSTLEEAIDVARARGPVRVDPHMAAVVQGLDPTLIDDASFGTLLALAGVDLEGGLPGRMAQINSLLAVAAPAVREAVLLAFIDRLSRPS
ncbi:MAG: aminotransferase class V-fold PLP-dependent enzyme [Nostocoides sp.]